PDRPGDRSRRPVVHSRTRPLAGATRGRFLGLRRDYSFRGEMMAQDPENFLILTLEAGPVVIKLRPDAAPNHVARIKELAREGFYDGVVFHRVIPGCMAQGGDPTGTGSGGSKKPNLKAEFNDVHHGRGVCSMARTNNPDTANSQFFICFDDA